MKGHKAVYYDSIIPPRWWMITASLLWDQIWMGPWTTFFETEWDKERFPWVNDSNYLFMQNLIKSETIIDASPDPSVDFENIKSPTGQDANEYLSEFEKSFEVFLNYHHDKSQDINKREQNWTQEDVSLFSQLRHRVIPNWLIKGYVGYDFFIEDLSSAQFPSTNISNKIIQSIETIIPLDSKALTVEKILDFRRERLLQRRKFQGALEKLADEFSSCSTEAELTAVTKQISDFIHGRMDDIDRVYRQYKINTVKKIMGLSISAPAVLAAVSSLLNVPFYLPAGILSAVSILTAEILNEREKAKSEIEQSNWAYLCDIKKLK